MSVRPFSHPDAKTLTAFLRGTLAAEDFRFVNEHVSTCESCQEALAAADQDTEEDVFCKALRSAASDWESDLATRDHPTIPRYEILEELGRGGMGVVYKALDKKLKRLVALKFILAGQFSTRQVRERFLREANTIARLQHRGIVQIYEVDEHDGHLFFVLELVNGCDLGRVSAGGLRPVTWIASVLEQVARAADYAHRQGFVHRDLKPANVLLELIDHTEPTEGALDSPSATPTAAEMLERLQFGGVVPVAKISDFGLAKPLDSADDLTRTGTAIGTPAYMSPEQAGGRADNVGPRSDVFSLGVILYELLTGRPPFLADSAIETLRMLREDAPAPPRRDLPGLPRDIETICLKCLEKTPSRRYASAAELADDLRRFLSDQPIRAQRASNLRKASLFYRRNRAVANVVAACLLVLTVGVVAYLRSFEQKNQELNQANSRLRHRGQQLLAASAEAKAKEADARQLAGQLQVAHQNAQRNLYASQIAHVGASYLLGDVATARSTLKKCAPPEFPEMRAWEWWYLQGICNREMLILNSPDATIPTDVAFSSDGRMLACVYSSRASRKASDASAMIALRDSFSGDVRHWIDARAEHVHGLEFSPDGQRLATVGSDGCLRIWMVSEQQAPEQLDSVSDLARNSRVQFSADGKSIAYVSKENAVVEYDLATAQTVLERSLQGVVESVSFNAELTTFVAITRNSNDNKKRQVAVFDREGTLRSADTLMGRIVDFVWSPKAQQFAARASNGRVTVFNVRSGRRKVIANENIPARCIAFSPDNRWLAVGGSDGVIRSWHIASNREPIVHRGHRLAVTSLRFTTDGSRLASTSLDGTIRTWDWTLPAASNRIKVHRGATDLASSADGEVVVLASHDECRWFDTVTGDLISECLFDPGAKRKPKGGVKLCPDGKLVASIRPRNEESLGVYDTGTGTLLFHLNGEKRPIREIVWSGDGQWIAAAAVFRSRGQYKSRVHLWKAAAGHSSPVWSLEREGLTKAIALNRDGSRLALGMHEQLGVEVLDAKTGEPMQHQTDVEDCLSLAFHPQGDILAAVDGRSAQLIVWSVAEDRRLYPPLSDGFRPVNVTFSPDGRRIAAVDDKSAVCLWDAKSGNRLISLKTARLTDTVGNKSGPPLATFSADGRRLYAFPGGASDVNIWSMATELDQFLEEHRRRLPFWHLEQASASNAESKRQAVEFHLQYAATDDVPGPAYWQQFSYLSDRLGETETARQAMMKCVEVGPDNSWSLYARGRYWLQKEEWANALADFNRAAKLNPHLSSELAPLQEQCRKNAAGEG